MSEATGLEQVRRQLRAASDVVEELALIQEVARHRGADRSRAVRQVWAGRDLARRPGWGAGDE